MKINSTQEFLTEHGNGIVIKPGKTISISNPPKYSTIMETPVRLSGCDLIQVGKIGAFSILPASGLLRCIESIGRFTIIAPDIQIGNPQHSTEAISPHPMFEKFDSAWNEKFHTLYEDEEWVLKMKKTFVKTQGKRAGLTKIGNDVWIGYGAVIMRGLEIGDGAIIAAGAVVTKDVEPYSIVGGVPSKVIKKRYDDATIEKLLELKWWEYGPDILKGLDLFDIQACIGGIEQRIKQGAKPYICDTFEFYENEYHKVKKTKGGTVYV